MYKIITSSGGPQSSTCHNALALIVLELLGRGGGWPGSLLPPPTPPPAPKQRAKKVVSDSPGLVDFAIRLVDSDYHLPDGQVKFFGN